MSTFSQGSSAGKWSEGHYDNVESPRHYASFAIEPIDYILANKLTFPEGCVVKYVTRWKLKNGIEDLRKARNFLDKLIAHEEKKVTATATALVNNYSNTLGQRRA